MRSDLSNMSQDFFFYEHYSPKRRICNLKNNLNLKIYITMAVNATTAHDDEIPNVSSIDGVASRCDFTYETLISERKP